MGLRGWEVRPTTSWMKKKIGGLTGTVPLTRVLIIGQYTFDEVLGSLTLLARRS